MAAGRLEVKNRSKRKLREEPNADGEPEQVLVVQPVFSVLDFLTSDAVFEPMRGKQPAGCNRASFLEVDRESQSE
jgi:hypothetical protein